MKTYGLRQEFLAHAARGEILEAAGLTPQHLARQLTEAGARRTPVSPEAPAAERASAAEQASPTERLPE